MRLKQLEVHGFKTFANRTAFKFSEGITAVVGPNGSGKSNVADGIRWAVDLGSQNYYSIEKLGMNLWNSKQDSDRWKIFRLSSSSHNVVTIDGQLHVASEGTAFGQGCTSRGGGGSSMR